MDGYPYHHHRPPQQQMMGTAAGGGVVGADAGDRFPQWSAQETKEFLMIRSELDRSFMETKRNKVLWEVIAAKMKEKGFSRSSDQCKCKWKNLVTRYKGCETMEEEAMRQQFPFYNELHAIFSARMQRMLWAEAEGSGAVAAPSGAAAASGKKRAAGAVVMSSDEEVEVDEDSENENRVVAAATPSSSRNKRKKGKGGGGGGGGGGTMREMVEEFMRKQVEMEVQWREAWEAREEERRRREEEWRRGMEALEKERLMTEKSWREREEQRRVREEARAEKRDALITALLNRLSGDRS